MLLIVVWVFLRWRRCGCCNFFSVMKFCVIVVLVVLVWVWWWCRVWCVSMVVNCSWWIGWEVG